MVGLSSDNPQAMTLTFLGNPIGSSISGLNIPELPTSVYLPSPGCYPNISMLGSVYGLYAGLNLKPVIPSFEKNSLITPIK